LIFGLLGLLRNNIMKLTKSQKEYRKEMLGWLHDEGGYIEVNARGDTFVIAPKGNTAKVSCAILNPVDEYKRKYGEYLALDRFYSGSSMLLPYLA
jgi:hypothetical protein